MSHRHPDEHSPADLVSEETSAPGQRAEVEGGSPEVGRFRILRKHAQGGLGVVWEAEDLELQRTVALKEIQACHADWSESRSRFVREAKITGSLEHPGIVPIYGFGVRENGRPYYAMKLIRGTSLKDYIDQFHAREASMSDRTREVELRKRLSRFLNVCYAIDYAHSQGVLHRDIKPDNVMLGDHGETLVVDWGLGKRINEPQVTPDSTNETIAEQERFDTAHTRIGSRLGTPGYMSPEQASARHELVDQRSDVYGLAATLYCLLTGRAPFRATTRDQLLAVVQEGVFPKPRGVAPRTARPLESICLRGMARESKDRYATAGALADDIERWLSDEPVTAHAESLFGRAARWSRRHRSWTLAATSALVLVSAVVAVAAVLVTRSNRDKELAERKEELEKEARRIDQYYSLVNNVRQRNAARRPGWRRNGLRDLAAAAKLKSHPRHLAELRTEAAVCLTGVDLHEDFRIPHAHSVRCLAFDHDGKRLAVGSHKNKFQLEIQIFNAADGARLDEVRFSPSVSEFVNGGDAVSTVEFGGYGKWLAAGTRSGRILLWDVGQVPARPIAEWAAHEDRVNGLCFTQDGGALYSGSDDRTVKKWRVSRTPEDEPDKPWIPRSLLTYIAASPIGSLSLNHQQTQLAIACGENSAIEVLATDNLRPAEPWQAMAIQGSSLSFSPDGQFLAVNAAFRPSDKGLVLFDAVSAEPLRTFVDWNATSTDPLATLQFHPSGALLLTEERSKRRVRIWDVATGKLLLNYPVPRTGLSTISPDGKRIAATSDTETIMLRVGGEEEMTAMAHHSRPVLALDTGKHLGMLVCIAKKQPADNFVTVWEMRSGKRRAEFDTRVTGDGVAVSIHPDGRRLAVKCQNSSPRRPMEIWRLGEGSAEIVDKIPATRARAICFSPDGQRLWASVDADQVKFTKSGFGSLAYWHVSDFQSRITPWDNWSSDFLSGRSGLTCMSAGKSWVVAGANDDVVRIFRTTDGNLVNKLTKPAIVDAIALSPDETLFATGDRNGQVCVMRVPSGEGVVEIDAHSDIVETVTFSNDGEWLATGSRDGSVRIWRVNKMHIEEWFSLRNMGAVSALRFSFDDNNLAILANNECAVRLLHLNKLRVQFARMGL